MESTGRNAQLAISFLWWGSALLLLARAWQYIYWDSPLRVLVWDEDAFSSVVQRLGWTWSDWVTSERVSGWIENWTIGLGIILLSAIVGLLLWKKQQKWSFVARFLVILGVAVLFFHALLETKSHYWRLGHFAELSLQWGTPALFFLISQPTPNYRLVDYGMRIAIALTFIGHGLYAFGYYPVPGHFQQMMISGFGVGNEQAILLLKWAGIFDFIAAALLFIPQQQIRNAALWYIIIWGFLTAFARLWTHTDLSSWEYLFSHWFPAFLVRSEHFLVPLSLFLWWKRRSINESSIFKADI